MRSASRRRSTRESSSSSLPARRFRCSVDRAAAASCAQSSSEGSAARAGVLRVPRRRRPCASAQLCRLRGRVRTRGDRAPRRLRFHGSAVSSQGPPRRTKSATSLRLHGPHSTRATAWRMLIDAAHGAYSSLGTPIAPWAGRLEALRFRRYVRFLRQSRAAEAPCLAEYERPSRATLRATLSRKRRIVERDG